MKSKILSLKTMINELSFKKISYNSMKLLNKKDWLLIAHKLRKNILDPDNAKEHYESCIVKENGKSVKQLLI